MGFFGLIPFVIVGVLGAIAFFLGRHAAKKHGRRLTQVEATPLAKGAQVGKYAGDVCKMHGEVIAPGGTLQSPIDGLECVWYRLLVEEQQTRTTRDSKGRNSVERVWVPVLDASKMVPCGIADKDGAIEVSLIEADMLVKDGAKKESGYFTDVPARLRTLIEEEYGRETSGGWFTGKKSLRVKEQVLEVGEKALVVGKVKLLRTDRGVRPRFVRGKQPLIVTDKNDEELRGHYKWAVFWSNLAQYGGAGGGSIAAVGFLVVLFWAAYAALFGPAPGKGGSSSGGLVAELTSKDKWVRIRAANRITRGPNDDEPAPRSEVAAALLANLKAKDEDVVKSAAEALPAWAEAGQSAELAELLGSKDGNARRGALKALGALDTAEGAAAATKHLTAGAEWREALNALKEMKAAGEPALRQYLADKAYGKNDKVAVEACKTLRDVGTKDTLPVLDALAKEKKGGLANEAKKTAEAIRKRGT